MRNAEQFGEDFFYVRSILTELWNSDWAGYDDPVISSFDRIKDEELKKIIKKEITSKEKRQKIYDYILNLSLEYKEYLKDKKQIYRDHISDVFLLIQELSFRNDEDISDITDKIFSVIQTLYI